MVKLRMARLGRPHRPFYRISAVDSRVKRDGAVLEQLGWYDPMAAGAAKPSELNLERIKYWLSVGAQPTLTVRNMLATVGLVDAAKVKAVHARRIEARKTAAAVKAANPQPVKKK